MHLYLIILTDIHSKLPFLRNKFNPVTISFFHSWFRLVLSNLYILYYKSHIRTIYCILTLLHYSASETSGKHIAKRTSTSLLSFITEFTSFPIYRAGFSIFSNISSSKASFLIIILSSSVKYGKSYLIYCIIYILGDKFKTFAIAQN